MKIFDANIFGKIRHCFNKIASAQENVRKIYVIDFIDLVPIISQTSAI